MPHDNPDRPLHTAGQVKPLEGNVEIEGSASADLTAGPNTVMSIPEPDEVRPLTRTDILEIARQNITVSRAEVHGDAEDSFAEIGEHWSIHLGIKVTNVDVAVMMTMFKLVRFKNNPPNPENSGDGAGYFAIAGELAIRRAAQRKNE